MNSQPEIERVEFKIKHNCRLCGEEIVFYASDPDSEIVCNNDNCLESQPFERKNIEEIQFDIVSQSPFYRITVKLLVDHAKQEFVPGDTGALYGNQFLSFLQVKKDVIKFLRAKGNKLTEEDFWRGYTFIEDFSRIKTI